MNRTGSEHIQRAKTVHATMSVFRFLAKASIWSQFLYALKLKMSWNSDHWAPCEFYYMLWRWPRPKNWAEDNCKERWRIRFQTGGSYNISHKWSPKLAKVLQFGQVMVTYVMACGELACPHQQSVFCSCMQAMGPALVTAAESLSLRHTYSFKRVFQDSATTIVKENDNFLHIARWGSHTVEKHLKLQRYDLHSFNTLMCIVERKTNIAIHGVNMDSIPSLNTSDARTELHEIRKLHENEKGWAAGRKHNATFLGSVCLCNQ